MKVKKTYKTRVLYEKVGKKYVPTKHYVEGYYRQQENFFPSDGVWFVRNNCKSASMVLDVEDIKAIDINALKKYYNNYDDLTTSFMRYIEQPRSVVDMIQFIMKYDLIKKVRGI